MSFPESVVLTTVTGQYARLNGSAASGIVVLRPDDTAMVGDGIALAAVEYRKRLDKTGKFILVIPASVVPDEDIDFTYEASVLLDGGDYSRKIVQVPVSVNPVNLEMLNPVSGQERRSRFNFPARSVRPASPTDGESYYDPATGYVYYWNAQDETWFKVGRAENDDSSAPSGPAGGSLNGTYPDPTLATNSVDTGHLKDASVTSSKLSVPYVPIITYNNDLATTALALGDLEESITIVLGKFAGRQGLLPVTSISYKSTPGAPTTGTWGVGDLVMDSTKTWYRCAVAGTPGTWA